MKLFRLPDGPSEAMHAADGQESFPTCHLARAQQLVLVDAGKLSALVEVFDASTALTTASFYAICDGQPQEYMIVLGGDEALANAQTLVAELQGAGLSARRSTVAHAAGAELLIAQARAAARASRQARMRLNGLGGT